MADTNKLMKALTIQVHMAAWERKTRKYGASPNQASNFIQQLQMDLESHDDQQNKMKDLVTNVLKQMMTDSATPVALSAPTDDSLTSVNLAQADEITRLKSQIK